MRLNFAPHKTVIIGVLNVTPDSFYDGGKWFDLDTAVARAREMIAEGADIIDIGGESSRPGSDPVTEAEEQRRVLPVITALAKSATVPLSIDTRHPAIARAALEAGASLVNDITGLRDQKMIDIVAKHKASVVIMHMQGEPKTMQDQPQYDDVVGEIKAFFAARIAAARAAGIADIILDPGIGFGKKLEHNLAILNRLEEFHELGCPLLIGASRKSFIGAITGAEIEDRLPGTIASSVAVVLKGVRFLRVHDVKECRQAIDVVDAIRAVR